MIQRMIIAAVLTFAASCITLMAQAGNRVQKALAGEAGERLYADVMMVPRASMDSADLFVSFRVAHDALTFTRVTDMLNNAGNYSAEFTLSVEVRDSIGVIRSRVRFKDTAYVNSYEESIDRAAMHHGSCRVGLAPGTYRVILETLSQRDANKRSVTLSPISFTPRSKTLKATGFIGLERKQGASWTIEPLVFNRTVPFGSKTCTAVFITADSGGATYDYTIRQMPYGPKDIRWWIDADYSGTVRSRADVTIRGQFESNRAAQLVLEQTPGSGMPMVMIPIDAPQLVPGNYLVRIVRKGGKDTIEFPFQVQWEFIPQSLRTLRYAIDALVYVCPEDQLDSLKEGSDVQNRERLMSWWRRMDPTPVTAYNERLAEYYTRVDHASIAFSSVIEPDGVFTDRGKVYILFGRPTKIDKKLSRSGASVETWTYRSGVRKTYEFEVSTDGVYRLKTITDTR
ncbi:MAG: GWxTD domain-containing protein [Candidatus Kapabacteria bacterium]|nr:GWxTD domain-containing protein [Candidatus Kapabacteria bacterium]